MTADFKDAAVRVSSSVDINAAAVVGYSWNSCTFHNPACLGPDVREGFNLESGVG